MTDKSKLLNELKIDRSESPAAGVSLGLVMGLVLLALMMGAAGSYFYIDSAKPVETIKVANESPASALSPAGNGSSTAAEQGLSQSVADNAPKAPVSDRLLNASGYITARRIATVSAEIMGLLTDVLVEEGMRVEAGQELARLDDAVASVNLRFAQAQVAVQRARLEGTTANLHEARRVLARVSELKTSDFSSEADVTRAQANVASLEAQMKQVKADIDVAKLEADRQQERLDDHIIKAPFGGVVTVKNAQPGEIVSPSSAGGGFTRTGICTIVDMDSLEIEVDVNEAFIGRVFDGQKVEANLDAYPNWTIPASVIAIIPTADRAKATVRVRIRIEEKDSRILPDMGVKVAFLKSD